MNKEKALGTQSVPVTVSECVHHWVIDTPSGPASRGRCKLCGGEREFKNYLDNTPYWENDVYVEQVSSGAHFHAGEAAGDAPEGADE